MSEAAALSRIRWRGDCEEVLEPLTGMARHPLSSPWPCDLRKELSEAGGRFDKKWVKGHPVNKYDVSHLVLSNRCNLSAGRRSRCRPHSLRGSGRALFYDLGSSIFGRMIELPDHTSAQGARSAPRLPGGYGPSIPLFYAMFARNCIEFDAIWAWEARHMPNWWRSVPEVMRKKLTFFNEPVNLTDASALGVLEATSRPEDFVVLKVDIDSPNIELSLVHAIANRPELSRLVDELFFEYHLVVDDARTRPKGFANSTVAEALDLMQRLRRLGVRAHFWV